jgi:ElaB/YqjD/DUF883 family membrane-anchored ribosome-binding protein
MTQATTTARIGRSRRHEAANTAAEGATSLRDQIGDSARELSETTGHEVAKVRHIVSDWLGDQVDQMRGAAGQMRARAFDAGDRTQRYVRDEPLKSMLLATAAGALIAGLAMLASRRRG